MIEKEKVEKIIRDFYDAELEQQHKVTTGDVVKDFAYGEKKKALLKYVQGLEIDEIIDLCALAECGKETLAWNKNCDWNKFSEIRESICYSDVLALDLLKLSRLNNYLRAALKLYEIQEVL